MVTAGGNHGMLFISWEDCCCYPVLVEVRTPAETWRLWHTSPSLILPMAGYCWLGVCYTRQVLSGLWGPSELKWSWQHCLCTWIFTCVLEIPSPVKQLTIIAFNMCCFCTYSRLYREKGGPYWPQLAPLTLNLWMFHIVSVQFVFQSQTVHC
jgi:hypothetical protein